MKDTEFIELLNLYLDHEISPEDTARLEAEVQRNPARYRIYQDYCRMQKACTLLAADFTADTPAVVAFESERRPASGPNLYAIGGLMAAAACVAFVFLNRTVQVAPTNSPVVVENSAPTIVSENPVTMGTPRGIARTVTVPTRRDEFHSVLAAHTLRLSDSAAVAETVPEAQLVKLDWIDKMQLSSLPRVSEDALRFETKGAITSARPSFTPGPLLDAPESAAWQFQR